MNKFTVKQLIDSAVRAGLDFVSPVEIGYFDNTQLTIWGQTKNPRKRKLVRVTATVIGAAGSDTITSDSDPRQDCEIVLDSIRVRAHICDDNHYSVSFIAGRAQEGANEGNPDPLANISCAASEFLIVATNLVAIRLDLGGNGAYIPE